MNAARQFWEPFVTATTFAIVPETKIAVRIIYHIAKEFYHPRLLKVRLYIALDFYYM